MKTKPAPGQQPGQAPPLLVVDGHNLLWRATFGFPAPIYSKDKQRRLTGLFGFFAILRKTVASQFADHPPEIVVAFDGPQASRNRQRAFAGYKAQRPSHPAALEPLTYLKEVKRGLDRHGLAWIEVENQEADDIIASLVARRAPGRQAVIMSSDKDFYQLISPRVTILNRQQFITEDAVSRTYGIAPAQWPDYRALTGDPADNIPGLEGVGPKTAAELLAGGHRLETIPADRTDCGRGRAAGQNLDQALAWRDLIRLNSRCDLGDLGLAGQPTPTLPKPADLVEALGLW